MRYPHRRNTPARQAWSALFVTLRNEGFGRWRNRENRHAGTKSFLNRRTDTHLRVHLDNNVPVQIDQLTYAGQPVAEPLVLEEALQSRMPDLPDAARRRYLGVRYTDEEDILYRLREIENPESSGHNQHSAFNYVFRERRFLGGNTYATEYQFNHLARYFRNLLRPRYP
jgi:hypothetical protein